MNVWRRMKDELKLYSYSRESVTAHLLGERIPHFEYGQLTRWYQSSHYRHRVLRHIQAQTELNLQLIDRLNLIRRTAESARLYGIDFFSVLTRGSQYRVEAVLLRYAHARGYLSLSPSRPKVARQAPLSVIPLVMEPVCRFYSDPVVVLDFQSLYPSMIIAYNLCYSTIIGKLKTGVSVDAALSDTTGRLGTELYREDRTARAMDTNADAVDGEKVRPFVAPNGSVFCHKRVREGVLPAMLREILHARVVVKAAMKHYKETPGKDNDVLRRFVDLVTVSIG